MLVDRNDAVKVGATGRKVEQAADCTLDVSNPALANGIAHEVGSVEVGKWADLVLWRPAFFGVKPTTILKGGFIAMALLGDANASIPTPQPVHYRPIFVLISRRRACREALSGGLSQRLTL